MFLTSVLQSKIYGCGNFTVAKMKLRKEWGGGAVYAVVVTSGVCVLQKGVCIVSILPCQLFLFISLI